MIELITRYDLIRLERDHGFTFDGPQGLDESIFLDMEHYIYRKPVALGIFGAAVREGSELVCTQYFLENKQDLKELVRASHLYLEDKMRAGYRQLVAFAARNDLMVLHAMFQKFRIQTDLRSQFDVLDLQSEFKRDHSAMIGLTALEEFAGIRREGPSISGSTIAKTFASIMADPDYIHRMPREKMTRLLDYNRMDVVNLFFIMANWDRISAEDVETFMTARAVEQQRKRETGSRGDGSGGESSPAEKTPDGK